MNNKISLYLSLYRLHTKTHEKKKKTKKKKKKNRSYIEHRAASTIKNKNKEINKENAALPSERRKNDASGNERANEIKCSFGFNSQFSEFGTFLLSFFSLLLLYSVPARVGFSVAIWKIK